MIKYSLICDLAGCKHQTMEISGIAGEEAASVGWIQLEDNSDPLRKIKFHLCPDHAKGFGKPDE